MRTVDSRSYLLLVPGFDFLAHADAEDDCDGEALDETLVVTW
jgi:hypothetical protein